MAERVHPSAKHTANGAAKATANGVNSSFPPNKAQLYNATRPAYRPQPPPPRRCRRGRSCCCSCCLWITLLITVILLLAAIAGAIFWVLYHPRRPSFSIISLRVSQFNLTTSSQLNSRFNLTVSATNSNSKITYLYDPIKVSLTSGGVDIGDGTLPGFIHGAKNTTSVRSVISTNGGQTLDDTAASMLKSNMKNRKGLPLEMQLNTKIRVKIGGLRTKKVGIRVTCEGVRAALPAGKLAAATTSDARCKVDLRVKIWKWAV